jgi:hypothetical protein
MILKYELPSLVRMKKGEEEGEEVVEEGEVNWTEYLRMLEKND